MKEKLVQKGANLMPKFDPEVTTHIIGKPSSRFHILRALNTLDPRKIPKHIPTLDWTWAVQKMLGSHEIYLYHELFHERMEDPYIENRDKPKKKASPHPSPKDSSQHDSSDIEWVSRSSSCMVADIL